MVQENRGVEYEFTDEGSARLRCLNHGNLATAAGLIHHSDRGVQYASKAFRQLLKAHGFQGSMSRRENY